MGRPLMISHKFSTASPSPLDDEKLETTQTPALPAIGFFLEATRLSKTLSVILTTIYDHNILDPDTSTSNSRNIQTPTEIDTVLELDKRLTKFQNEVPIELHWGQAGEKLRQSLECHVEILEMQANVLHARWDSKPSPCIRVKLTLLSGFFNPGFSSTGRPLSSCVRNQFRNWMKCY